MTRPRPLRAIDWNAYVGNQPSRVVNQLKVWAEEHDPHVFALQEVAPFHNALRASAGEIGEHGYALFQQAPLNGRQQRRTRAGKAYLHEAGNVALLVRRDLVVRKHNRARMRRWWTGPKHGLLHSGRISENALVDVEGYLWKVKASHYVWAGKGGARGRNAAAYLEQAARSQAWSLVFRRRGSTAEFADFNGNATTLRRLFGRAFKVTLRGVDGVVTRRVTTVDIQELEKGGSDTHHGLLLTLTP